jgi:two-component system OmpR family sensor kinase
MAKIKIAIHRPWIPYIILTLTLTLTILSAFYISRATYIEDRLRFLNAVQDTSSSITDRMNTYITLLRGTAGLYETNSDSPQQFDQYVKQLHLQKNYPAVQGIGFIQVIANDQKDSFIQSIQNTNPQFTIYPAGDRDNYYVVRYLHLRTNETPSSIGYDMGTNPVRLKALETARDTGTPTMSGKVAFLSKGEKKTESGFLIFTPIYTSGDVPLTVAQRRAKIEGFVYSPFGADTFFKGILGDKTLPQLLNIEIYDNKKINKKTLLHDSRTDNNDANSMYSPKFQITRAFIVAGEPWTIIFSSHPEFESESQEDLSFFIFIGGLLVSIMLFMLSRSQYIARKNAESVATKLQYSQKELEKAIGLRDNFISIASHELKTPVTSLKVYAQMLHRQFSQKGDNKTTEYLSKIIKQIDKLTMLIQDLLNVSRIESNQLTFRIENFNVNTMVKEVIENTQQISERHKIILKGKSKNNVWGDRERISQVLINLLTNAIKYSPKSDKIIVTVKDIKKGALISVQDFGIGIKKTHQKKIFDRFYRISGTNEQTFPGLGIGLFISQTIVKRHGGEIIIISERGKGSVFQFILPYEKIEL